MRFRRLRTWLLRSVLVLVAALLATYAVLTRPAALRSYLTAALQPTGLRITDGSAISFAPWSGLTATELELFQPGAPSDTPPLLHITRARIPLRFGALLLGRLSLSRIEAEGVVITVVADPDLGAFAGSTGAASDFASIENRRRMANAVFPTQIPPVEISSADLQILARESGHLSIRRRTVVQLSGRPDPDGKFGPAYAVTLRPQAGLEPGNLSPLPALMSLRWTRDTINVSTDWIDAAAITPYLPPEARNQLKYWGVGARARLANCEIRAGQLRSVELTLQNGAVSLPVEPADAGIAPEARFLHITDVRGSLNLRPPVAPEAEGALGTATLNLSGRMHSGSFRAQIVAQDARLHLAKLIGEDLPLAESISCGPYQAEFNFEDFECPTLERQPQFVTSERIPNAIRAFIGDYKPHGNVSLSFNVSGSSARRLFDGTDVKVSGALEPRSTSCRYFRFPYEVRDIHGRIAFDDSGVTFDGLVGRHGSAVIIGKGHVADTSDWAAFELAFDAVNVAMDRDIYEALPAGYRQLWEEADPRGLCDLRVTLIRPRGSRELGAEDPRIHIDTLLTSGSVQVLNDTTLDHVSGMIHVGDDSIRVERLDGFQGGAGVFLSGAVTIPSGEEPPARSADFIASQAPVDRSSTVTHPDGSELGRIHFNGAADVWGRVSGTTAALEPVYAAHVTSGRLSAFEPDHGWDHAAGWIVSSPQTERVITLTVHRPGGELELAGDLPAGSDPPRELTLRAKDEAVESLLPQLIPSRWGALHRNLAVSGPGTIAVAVHGNGTTAGAAADITFDVARMQPQALPLGLHDVHAEITLDSNGYVLREARASGDEAGEVTGSGRGGWGEDQIWSEWTVGCAGFDCTPRFVQAMPVPLATLLRRTNLRGKLDLRLDPVRFTQQGDHDLWSFSGAAKLQDATLDLGLPLSVKSGEVRGLVTIDPNGDAAISGTAQISAGTFGGRTLSGVEGHITHGFQDRRIAISDLHGTLAGGEATGDVKVDTTEGDYEATLVFRGANLTEFLNRPVREGQPPNPGVVDGNLYLRGVGDEHRGQRGGGQLIIRDASLLSTPVSAEIVKAGQKSKRKVNPAVDSADLEVQWEGDTFHFQRVAIQSRDQRLLGDGDWDQKTDRIAVTLYSIPPKAPTGLEPLAKLLQSASDELFQVRVEGTAADPKAHVEALYALTEPLKRLLAGQGTQPGNSNRQ